MRILAPNRPPTTTSSGAGVDLAPPAAGRIRSVRLVGGGLGAPVEGALAVADSRHARVSLRHVRAWMVVLPVDAVLLLTPLLWAPRQRKAILTMAVLAVLLVTGGHRYRARLHLSVLDELPTLVGRLLTAAALVATVIALRPEPAAVPTFLLNTAICVGLVVVGRVATSQLIGWSRRHRITAHRTLVIGGGTLSAELARILLGSPRYGLAVVGFVDDGTAAWPRRSYRIWAVSTSWTGWFARSVPTCFSSPMAISPSATWSTPSEPRARRVTCSWCPACTISRHRPARRPHRLDPGDAHPDAEPAGSGMADQARLRCGRGRPAAHPGHAGHRLQRAGRAPGERPRGDLPADPGRAGRSAVRLPEDPDVFARRRNRVGHELVGERRPDRTGRSASCGAPRSTSCRSCGTSFGAT